MANAMDEYLDARAVALALPSWVLRIWERRATDRLGRGSPRAPDQARLLAVRTVLNERSAARRPTS